MKMRRQAVAVGPLATMMKKDPLTHRQVSLLYQQHVGCCSMRLVV